MRLRDYVCRTYLADETGDTRQGIMEREYDYRPGLAVVLLSGIFFAACALVLGARAYTNDRGLVINGIIELSPGSATVFYCVLTGFSVGFVAAAAVLAGTQLTLHQRIAYTETCLILPRSRWSAEEVTVPFSDILSYSAREIYGQRMLTIVYKGGKFTVGASMLPSTEAFDEICKVVARHCPTGW